jgi:hypothetical protein
MVDLLKHFTKKQICDAVDRHSKITGTPFPDRLCYRFRDGMICFFCERYPHFPCSGPIIGRAATPAETKDQAPMVDEDWEPALIENEESFLDYSPFGWT